MLKNPLPTAIAAPPPTTNLLLGRLAAQNVQGIFPHLRLVELPLRQLLYEPNVPIHDVYFPVKGLVSLVVVSPDGAVEMGSVGSEGFVGISALLHGDSMPGCALVQAEGHAYCMSVDAFRAFIEESDAARTLLSRYTLALINQVGQSVACNRLHALEARCARWLLIMHDRVDGDEIFLTQEFLSYMLGVHRPAVTLAARILHKAGFIAYTRGRIRVTNREGLEQASCSCYRAVRDDFEALIGASTG